MRTITSAAPWMWAGFLVFVTGSAVHALPAGRAWSDREIYLAPPGQGFSPSQFFVRGRELAVLGITLGYQTTAMLSWRDSTWDFQIVLPYHTAATWPVASPPGTRFAVWQTFRRDLLEPTYLVIGDLTRAEVELDTVTASAVAVNDSYSAAVGARYRWAAMDDPQIRRLQVFASEPPGEWRLIGTGANATFDVAVGILSDSTALIAWASQSPSTIRYGIATGAEWDSAAAPPFADAGSRPARPRFRRASDGTLELYWLSGDHDVLRSAYRGGVWSPLDSISCDFDGDNPLYYISDTIHLSSNSAATEPSVAYSAYSYRSGIRKLCVYVPDSTGMARVVPGAEDSWIPVITQDVYGETWLAWRLEYGQEMFWQHTYVTATGSTPVVERAGARVQVTWQLDSPAPGSTWSIERSSGLGGFDSVGVAVAGDEESMAWTDADAPQGAVRYRVRRVSLDRRYEWTSAEGRWPVAAAHPVLFLVGANRAGADVQLLDAAPGRAAIALYDIQGRAVQKQDVTVGGSNPTVVRVAYDALARGVYFLRATDAVGVHTPVLRLVVIR